MSEECNILLMRFYCSLSLWHFASSKEGITVFKWHFKRLLNACQFSKFCVKAATTGQGRRFILAVKMFK